MREPPPFRRCETIKCDRRTGSFVDATQRGSSNSRHVDHRNSAYYDDSRICRRLLLLGITCYSVNVDCSSSKLLEKKSAVKTIFFYARSVCGVRVLFSRLEIEQHQQSLTQQQATTKSGDLALPVKSSSVTFSQVIDTKRTKTISFPPVEDRCVRCGIVNFSAFLRELFSFVRVRGRVSEVFFSIFFRGFGVACVSAFKCGDNVRPHHHHHHRPQ